MLDMAPISLDEHSSVPPYEQVREQIKEQVTTGELTPGTKLPPVRRLAEDLGLAANTVARAYRELETLGVIETRGRAGSVVSGDGVAQAARQAAHDYAARARELGLGEADAVALLQRAFR
jgi:DNA-binding transcriptional regulator YhcF (GntR family)